MPFRIGIAGIGGVGGYIGGMLAVKFAGSSDVEVIFIGRPESAEIIRSRGLDLTTPAGELNARPSLVVSDPAEAGKLDLVILCTKSYSLEESLASLRPAITAETILLPLLNGVDLEERIHAIYPRNHLWEGCIYIVAELRAPGDVLVTSKRTRIIYGSTPPEPEPQAGVHQIFTSAGIEATVADDITQAMWQKYFLISPLATLSSYLDQTVGPIRDNQEYRGMLLILLEELRSVAEAKGVDLPADTIEKTLGIISSFAVDSMTSMHRDFRKGGKTEVDSLTGYVVRAGKELDVPTPLYRELLTGLQSAKSTR